eukprot:12898229-Alexandrium_andersonii.AAC.1
MEEVRNRWAGRRTAVRITQTKVAVGCMPGQAGGGVAAVWDVAARATGLHAAAARDEIRAAMRQMPCCDGPLGRRRPVGRLHDRAHAEGG